MGRTAQTRQRQGWSGPGLLTFPRAGGWEGHFAVIPGRLAEPSPGISRFPDVRLHIPGSRFARPGTTLWLDRVRDLASRQFFSRYPVLKIHHTSAMQIARKPSVTAMLSVTLTSEIS